MHMYYDKNEVTISCSQCFSYEKFENTKDVIRSRKLKDTHYTMAKQNKTTSNGWKTTTQLKIEQHEPH